MKIVHTQSFAAQKGVSGIFGPDMFLVPRNEVVLNESGFADMTMDTRFILSDEVDVQR